MLEFSLGVAFFTTLVMGLLSIVLAAKSKLVAQGEVNITINERKVLTTLVGTKLLGALADASIYVPSACGGIGTCGFCRVKVDAGGGAALPVEASRMTKREIAAGTRLACQVTIKHNMQIWVADEVFGVQQWQCTVRSNTNVAPLIKEIVLELPSGEAPDFRAGDFIQLTAPPYRLNFTDFVIDPAFRHEWERLDLWRYTAASAKATTRAYSMANYPEEKGLIILLVRIAVPPPNTSKSLPPGVVSSYMFSLKPGDTVTIAGPFGHFLATSTQHEMVYVGGGVGMAPMRSHLFDQLKRLHSQRKITFWYGARSRQDLFYIEDFDRLQAEHEHFRWHLALSDPKPEDNWQGQTGFIHDVLYEQYLKDHPAPEDCEYYICGPPLMMQAVMRLLDNLGVEQDHIFFDDFGG
jgi:Na+-transporting NADH:ubiquinone oxidoreductase subunit F